MDSINPRNPTLSGVIAGVVTVIVGILSLMEEKEEEEIRPTLPPSVPQQRDNDRQRHMHRIFFHSESSCVHYLRMSREAFRRLANKLKTNGSLRDTQKVSVQEQLAMFLFIMGHKSTNRVCGIDFARSGETVSRYQCLSDESENIAIRGMSSGVAATTMNMWKPQL